MRSIFIFLGRFCRRSQLLPVLAWLVSSVPSTAAIALVGPTVHQSRVGPGGVFDGVIRIQNSDTNASLVRVYVSDYRTGTNGTSLFADPGTFPRSNGKWFALSADSLEIPPKASREVNYRGLVPQDPQLNGSYWSLVFIEEQTPIPPLATNSVSKRPQAAIRTVVRFATIVMNEIGNEVDMSLKVLDRKVIATNSLRALSLLIENRGNRMTVPVPSLEVLDPQGSTLRKVDLNPTRIFPGSSVRLDFDLAEVPDGKFTGIVMLDTGDPSQLLAVKCPILLGPKP